MKIRLQLKGDNTDEIRERLVGAGFEIGDDGEYVLMDAEALSDSSFKENEKQTEFLLVRDEKGQRSSISEDHVIFIESYGHDVEVHTTEGTYFSPERLYQLSEILNHQKFIRVSNSAIVAKEHVKKIRPSLSMKFVLTMSDGTPIDVTRSYYYAFKEFFGI